MPAEWMSLSEAAELIGVHPSTVRAWSNQGLLPVHRTGGGHRRYLRSEVELWKSSQQTAQPGEFDRMAQAALQNTRLQVSEGRLNSEHWYQKLDDDSRDQYRRSGRVLLRGLLDYLGSQGSQAEAEARSLGYEYAARGRRCGLNAAEAAQAFLFFRTQLVEAMLGVYEAAAVRSPAAWSEMFRKMNTFTDQILLTLLETYEAHARSAAPGGGK
jgi:excisionase family DNA binding protein